MHGDGLIPGATVLEPKDDGLEMARERWTDCHRSLVETVYKDHLRSMSDEVEDGVQSFWMWFFEKQLDRKFDPAAWKEEAYIRVLAKRRAINWFWGARRRLRRLEQIGDENAIPEVQTEAVAELHPWLATYLCDLVATNGLEAHLALIMVCKDWADVGPSVLAEKFSSHTLFQLCDFVDSRLDASGNGQEEPLRLIYLLRQQLGLPPHRARGLLRLCTFVNETGSSCGEGDSQDRAAKSVLYGWLDQSRRVFLRRIRSSSVEESRQIAAQVKARVRQDLQGRLEFMVELWARKRDPEKLLVWGWLRVLQMNFEDFCSFPCNEAARWFAARMHFLLPQYKLPDELADWLAGEYPFSTLSETIERLETTSERTRRAVEERYKRFSARKELNI